MTYTDWQKLPVSERIERCAKALGWTIGDYEEWDPLRSRDDCQALIVAVAALRDPAKQMRFGQRITNSIIRHEVVDGLISVCDIIDLYALVDPDLLVWAACEALLEGK